MSDDQCPYCGIDMPQSVVNPEEVAHVKNDCILPKYLAARGQVARLQVINRDYWDKYTLVQQWLGVERKQTDQLRDQVKRLKGLVWRVWGHDGLTRADVAESIQAVTAPQQDKGE